MTKDGALDDRSEDDDQVDLADETLADLDSEEDVEGAGGATWTKYRDLRTVCQTCMQRM
jgi:hypothetical protein